jgi:hypothetical protein
MFFLSILSRNLVAEMSIESRISNKSLFLAKLLGVQKCITLLIFLEVYTTIKHASNLAR